MPVADRRHGGGVYHGGGECGGRQTDHPGMQGEGALTPRLQGRRGEQGEQHQGCQSGCALHEGQPRVGYFRGNRGILHSLACACSK